MQCNSTRFTTGTFLNFLGFITNYPACRPAACKKFQQSQLGLFIIIQDFAFSVRSFNLDQSKIDRKKVVHTVINLDNFWIGGFFEQKFRKNPLFAIRSLFPTILLKRYHKCNNDYQKFRRRKFRRRKFRRQKFRRKKFRRRKFRRQKFRRQNFRRR